MACPCLSQGLSGPGQFIAPSMSIWEVGGYAPEEVYPDMQPQSQPVVMPPPPEPGVLALVRRHPVASGLLLTAALVLALR